MNEEIPTLNYAPAPPRLMRKKLAVAIGLGVAGITIAAGAKTYLARQARPMRTGGVIMTPRIQWQPQTPAGTLNPGVSGETDSTSGAEEK